MATERKEFYEYVELEDHDLIVNDLTKSSADFNSAISKGNEMLQLDTEKHEQVAKAKELVKEAILIVNNIAKLMHKKVFESMLRKPHREPVQPKTPVRKQKSQVAIKELKRSLDELENLLLK